MKSLEKLNKAYQQLDLTSHSSEETFAMIHSTFLKAAKEDGLQMKLSNDARRNGLLVAYGDRPNDEERRTVTNYGLCGGYGNLLSTILLFLQSAGKLQNSYRYE